MTINAHVEKLLTIYSQSELSTGGTRGYDPETYVETKLDHSLIPRILQSQMRLVILTGNAGDGKTAFIQHIFGMPPLDHIDHSLSISPTDFVSRGH